MQMFAEISPDKWLYAMERRLAGVNALRILVDRPGSDSPDPITDPERWVHLVFTFYRSGMPDNHFALAPLARIEHDFIAALAALNFDDQSRQLRLAFNALQMFHHVHR